MIEKPVPWWRKALHYALSGIRSGFGLFHNPANPALPQSSSPEEDRFPNSPESTPEPEPVQDLEQTLEVEEALTDHPANPEAAVPIAEGVIEPAPAAVSEAGLASDPLPAPAGEIAPTDEIGPADVTDSQPASQTAGKLDSEGGGGFNPRTKPTGSTWALAPEAVQPLELRPEPIVESAPVAESTPAAAHMLVNELSPTTDPDPVSNVQEVGPTPEPLVAQNPFAETAQPVEEEVIVAEDVMVGEEVIVAEPSPAAESIQIGEPSPAVDEGSASLMQQVEPDPELPLPPDPVEPGEELIAEAASIQDPIAQEAAAEPAPVAEPISANLPDPDPTPVPSSTQPPLQPPAQPAPDPIAAEKAAAKLLARQKKLDDAAELSPFSVIVGQVYTGPLDLLLDLIRQQDIDIYDIPIAKITAQFLAYVNQLKASDVDVAGEFIYTASLLIHIKSKMLLPRSPAGPNDTPEDPRRELVERLLEHERFKNAAQMLQQKQMLEAATWTNPGFREFQDDDGAEPEIAADTVDLVRIFRDILERARNRPVIDVEEDAVTVGQMIQFLARRLTLEDKPIALRRLLSHTRSERALVAMFLALLELVRLQAVLLRQDRAFSDIFIKKHTGFDAVMNQGLANALDDWR
jgi:segregation and condensation protein A